MPAPKPERPPQPGWLHAPNDATGGVVPIQLVLARTDKIAVVLSRLVAFDSGFMLELAILARDETGAAGLMAGIHGPANPEETEQSFRFGLLMPDGSKLTVNRSRPTSMLSADQLREFADAPAPPTPIIMPSGGGGGDRRWESKYWIAPLPPLAPFRWSFAGMLKT